MAVATTDYATLDDEALIALARAGQRQALEALLERYAPRAFSIAAAVLRHREDALDTTQTVLLQLTQDVISSQWRATPLLNYIYRRAHLAAVDLLRQKVARRCREGVVAAQGRLEDAPMAGEQAERTEALNIMRVELSALDADSAAALALFHLDGLSVNEVAKASGVSVDACKQRLSRAREKLRERVERRGVALAGVALVDPLLADVFASARALCAQIEKAQFETLAQHIASQSSKLLPVESSPSASATEAAAQGAQPASRNAGMEKVLIAVLCLTLAVGVGIGLFAGRTDRRAEGATEAPDTASGAGGAAQPAVTPLEFAGSRWQTPRFIAGELVPLSMAVRGSQVTILATDLSKQPHAEGLVLLRSSNGGESIERLAEIPGYGLGSVAVNNEGGFEIFAMKTVRQPGGGLLDNQPQALSNELQDYTASPSRDKRLRFHENSAGLSFDWIQYTRAGVRTQASGVWSAADAEVFKGLPRIVTVADGLWAFTLKREGIAVARAAKGSAPAEIKHSASGMIYSGTHINAHGHERPPAWAKDISTAGFVLHSDVKASERKLFHCATTDGGRTWAEQVIPFAPASESSTEWGQPVPLDLHRQDDVLTLLVMVSGTYHGGRSHNDHFVQHFVLRSSDLGRSWSNPLPAGERYGFFNLFSSHHQLHCTSSTMITCSIQSLMFGRKPLAPGEILQADRTIRVRLGEDEGNSWQRHHAFDALSDARAAVLGGDGQSLHLALFRVEKDMEPYLIIRSFAPGDWQPGVVPPWFKDDAVPAPTKEDF